MKDQVPDGHRAEPVVASGEGLSGEAGLVDPQGAAPSGLDGRNRRRRPFYTHRWTGSDTIIRPLQTEILVMKLLSLNISAVALSTRACSPR